MPVPPKTIQNNAARALREREKYDGLSDKPMTAVGVARARDISNGADLSLSTLKRMVSFLSRHRENYRPGERKNGRLSKGTIAYLAWGGLQALGWAKRQVAKAEK